MNSSQDKPKPPYNLTYFLISPTSVQVNWSVDDESRDKIKAFSLHLAKCGKDRDVCR